MRSLQLIPKRIALLLQIGFLFSLVQIITAQSSTEHLILSDSPGPQYVQKKRNELAGNLTIQYHQSDIITQAHPRVIKGDVNVHFNPYLITLDGLDIEEISGSLRIVGNNQIADISALNSLRVIEGDLVIRGNDNLTSLEGLSNVYIGGNVIIENNDKLQSINGLKLPSDLKGHLRILGNRNLSAHNSLAEITRVRGDIIIANNPALKQLESLSSLQNIGGDFRIVFNSGLGEIQAIQNLKSIGGSFVVEGNSSLVNLGSFENLEQVSGDFILRKLTSLEIIDGWPLLTKINGSFKFHNLPKLMKLPVWASLNSIDGDLILSGNSGLIDIIGLSRLRHLSGRLVIENNLQLSQLLGLNDLLSEEIKELVIIGNPVLDYCHVNSICSFLNNHDTELIQDNSQDCSTANIVRSFCLKEEIENSSFPKVYPNPASSEIRLLEFSDLATINIYDSGGKVVYTSSLPRSAIIPIGNLSSGTYMIETITAKGVRETGTFVKQ